MLINSIPFLIFFLIVFILYYSLFRKNRSSQNWLILISSYVFYGYANWRIVPLLLMATLIFYVLGIAIKNEKSEKKASWLTTLGVVLGVGLLVYFKYFNFFIESFSTALNEIGLHSNIGTFNIILPLGISFFTFKLISYLVEISRGKIEPTKDLIAFSGYIAFFPTILSGPIDRPNIFLPQLQKKRTFDYNMVVDGLRQILWGLFLKMVIADHLSGGINEVWTDIPNQSSLVLFIAAILYSIQLYTDFSGYSHIAIGVGKLLGFRITKNFNYPFFSRNVAEFWRNWHISLTSWLTEYIFMPLNIKFRNWGNWGIIFAIIINMVLVGMWHGANWTFAIFGLFHGLLFIPLIWSGAIFKKKKLKPNKLGLPSLKDFSKILGTFLLVTLGLVIFRAENISQAWEYMVRFIDIPSHSVFDINYSGLSSTYLYPTWLFIILFFIIEWNTRKKEHGLANLEVKFKKPLRMAIYALFVFFIGIYMFSEETPFIYIQF